MERALEEERASGVRVLSEHGSPLENIDSLLRRWPAGEYPLAPTAAAHEHFKEPKRKIIPSATATREESDCEEMGESDGDTFDSITTLGECEEREGEEDEEEGAPKKGRKRGAAGAGDMSKEELLKKLKLMQERRKNSAASWQRTSN